ncbi:MAG: 3-oxoacyl-ACP reductase FabG [Firmicutes bacterium]|nr:3-oxoacyl-ACP reductase FabG [Bacillota bacterium]
MKKVALITGSSRGIGRAEAIKLAHDGYAVCINCVEREDKAQEAVEQLVNGGCEAMWYKADVADAAAVKQMVTEVEKTLGAVTLLVNNAGIAKQCLFQDMTENYWKRIFDVNLNGAFNTIQAVLPHMLHEHSGCIINTSSIWGQHGASCEVAYSATKHAIIGLTRSLAQELAPTNIRVNCVAPGVIDTDMVQVLGTETLDALAEDTPVGRLGRPEDIAAVVSFLASDAASFITGQVITSDGGFMK